VTHVRIHQITERKTNTCMYIDAVIVGALVVKWHTTLKKLPRWDKISDCWSTIVEPVVDVLFRCRLYGVIRAVSHWRELFVRTIRANNLRMKPIFD